MTLTLKGGREAIAKMVETKDIDLAALHSRQMLLKTKDLASNENRRAY